MKKIVFFLVVGILFNTVMATDNVRFSVQEFDLQNGEYVAVGHISKNGQTFVLQAFEDVLVHCWSVSREQVSENGWCEKLGRIVSSKVGRELMVLGVSCFSSREAQEKRMQKLLLLGENIIPTLLVTPVPDSR